MNDRVASFHAGCDLNMPGGSKYGEKSTIKAIKENTLSETEIDSCVDRILDFVQHAPKAGDGIFDKEAHHLLARKSQKRERYCSRTGELFCPVRWKI